jgi:tryptophan-rich sensory protein
MTRFKQYAVLVVFVGICLGAAGIGGWLTDIGPWYRELDKPSWTPPNWVFGPVWTFLYVSMGVAAWLVWRRGGLRGAALALGLFGFQLVLNVIWSGLFFALHEPGYALIDIVALWIAIAATALAFARWSVAAGWLMVPYLV